MILFSICLLVLLGVSLMTFTEPRPKATSGRSAYDSPPADWPDVPVEALSLFQPKGRINQPMPKPVPPRLRRFRTFGDTQAFVMGMVDPKRRHTPKIGLQLSEMDGPEWTDVLLDGTVVAHVQTMALTAGRPVSTPTRH